MFRLPRSGKTLGPARSVSEQSLEYQETVRQDLRQFDFHRAMQTQRLRVSVYRKEGTLSNQSEPTYCNEHSLFSSLDSRH
jgi:hypothetical protein